MPLNRKSSEVLAHVSTPDGVAIQVRHDAIGVLEAPELENVLISVHLGAPARIACRRDGRRFVGTAVHGDIDIIPARTPSRWEIHDENDTALIVSLPQSLLRTVANESGIDHARLEIRNRYQIRDPELEALSSAMRREMEAGCPSGRFYLDGLALAAASRLIARHSGVSKPAAELHQGLSGRKLKLVLSFIDETLAENISIEHVASVAGVSASHLTKLFRQSTGLPVHQYVIQRRVERARALIASSELTMAEIAQAVGFTHESHMARHMRRALGAPPKAIRRSIIL
ncbi:MAG: Transcriptional regulator, AraC family [Candidatus Solibacter sp.]|nr:Transcriptional regulator, AraC family [Candidatus Solibacter sp.]